MAACQKEKGQKKPTANSQQPKQAKAGQSQSQKAKGGEGEGGAGAGDFKLGNPGRTCDVRTECTGPLVLVLVLVINPRRVSSRRPRARRRGGGQLFDHTGKKTEILAHFKPANACSATFFSVCVGMALVNNISA
jgi:hypothetical protein